MIHHTILINSTFTCYNGSRLYFNYFCLQFSLYLSTLLSQCLITKTLYLKWDQFCAKLGIFRIRQYFNKPYSLQIILLRDFHLNNNIILLHIKRWITPVLSSFETNNHFSSIFVVIITLKVLAHSYWVYRLMKVQTEKHYNTIISEYGK